MILFTSLWGAVTAEITGADIPGTLDLLTSSGISILGSTGTTELTASITIPRRYFPLMKRLCEKRGDTVRLLRRSGLYWTAKGLARRPVLTLGVLLCLMGALYLPSRVFFVRVVGNISVPTRLILEAAEGCGIGFGASRRAVRSERMKNALLEAVPQLQWAGVNTYGCVAEISVRERALEKSSEEDSGFGHITAGLDGVILSATATRGNLLCAPGEAVSAGDILISGYTDCGLTIRAEQAEGEIFAATRRKSTVITLDSCLSGIANGDISKKISLLIGKKRINLWKDSGIWDSTCDRMYEEYYITLPGGFQLPFGWSVERFVTRQYVQCVPDPGRLRELLAAAGESYLKDQMVSGIIRDSDLSFAESDGLIQMTGEYSCVEMIGFRQRLEIGDKNGENN